jgi:uncharacterized protein YndB with AHSA1/START domain
VTIRKSIYIERPRETVFDAFCNEIGSWWPIKQGFAFGGKRTTNILLVARLGGRFFEQLSDGSELEVGRVTAYDPPALVAFSWRAPAWEGATQVRALFSSDGAGTRVDLEHSGWEQGPAMSADAKDYEQGWEFILGLFRSYAVSAAESALKV